MNGKQFDNPYAVVREDVTEELYDDGGRRVITTGYDIKGRKVMTKTEVFGPDYGRIILRLYYDYTSALFRPYKHFGRMSSESAPNELRKKVVAASWFPLWKSRVCARDEGKGLRCRFSSVPFRACSVDVACILRASSVHPPCILRASSENVGFMYASSWLHSGLMVILFYLSNFSCPY